MSSRIPNRPLNSLSTLSTPSPLPKSSSPGDAVNADQSRNSALRSSGGTLFSRVRTEGDSERVKVYARIRPALRDDETPGALAWSEEDGRLTISRPDAPVPQSDFVFTKVLGPGATQADVYSTAVSDVVSDVIRGYNGTILAYGQTGAGKTYTLGNTAPDAIGMIPRAAAELFAAAARDPVNSYRITMSYIQIYMEMIQDLLNPTADNLPIREDASGVFVAGACEVPVTSLEECLHYLELGERNRVFAFTHLNAHSSRSHAVVMLNVVKGRRFLTDEERTAAESPDQDGVVTQKVTVGRLYMVDLAGSERLKKSKSVGLRATEARSINLSLTMLGMCISARAQDSPHVPFRDSKLTRLLQESLGGNAKTSLILCLSDVRQHADESLQSLQFGARAACVRNKPMVNERQLRRQLTAELLAALEQGHERVDGLEAALTQTKEERDALQAALARERARSAAIADALRVEAEAREAAAQAQLAQQAQLLSTHVQQLDQVQQQQGQLEKEVARLREEQRSREEAHKAELAALNEQLAAVQDAAERDRETAAADAQSQRAQAAQAAQIAQRHTSALAARLAQERGASREQATSIHLALTMLQQALGELAGRPVVASDTGSGVHSTGPVVQLASAEGQQALAVASTSEGSGRPQWLAGLAAAVAAATSRRASASGGPLANGSASGSAVQAIQEALGLTAETSDGSAAVGDSVADGPTVSGSSAGSSVPVEDASPNSGAACEQPAPLADVQPDTASSVFSVPHVGSDTWPERPSAPEPPAWYPPPMPLLKASNSGKANDRPAYASSDRHSTNGLVELDAALAAARQDLLADCATVQHVSPDPSLPYPESVVPPLPPLPAPPPPLMTSASMMLPTPPASARGPVKTNMSEGGSSRYPTVYAGASSAPQSPGYGQLYARRMSGAAIDPSVNPYTSTFSTPSRHTAAGANHTAIPGTASSRPGPVHASGFLRDGVVVSGGGASNASFRGSGHVGATQDVHSSVLSLNPAFDTMDSEVLGGEETDEQSSSTGALRASLEAEPALVSSAVSASTAGPGPVSALRASVGAAPQGSFSQGPSAGAPTTASPLFAGIQVQLGALMETVAVAKRVKIDLEARAAHQANEIMLMQEEQQQAEAGAQQVLAQLQATRHDLAATESQLASVTSELEDTRRSLDETMQLLVDARGELHQRSDELQETRERLAVTASRLEEAVGQLEEAGLALKASEEEGRRLQKELEETQAALAAERDALRLAQEAAARCFEASTQAFTARHEIQRQVRAANTIKTAFRRYKISQLKEVVAAKDEALTAANAHQREREAAQAARQAAQAAQAGQALVQESVVVMRDAVESILTAFVGRRYELEAKQSLNDRLARVLHPTLTPRTQPHVGLAGFARKAESSREAQAAGPAAKAARSAHRTYSLSLLLAAATAPSPAVAPVATATGAGELIGSGRYEGQGPEA